LRLFVNKLVGLRILRHRIGRHAIAAVDPPGKILKFAALAAEGNPGCLCGLATAKHTHASRHGGNSIAGRWQVVAVVPPLAYRPLLATSYYLLATGYELRPG